MDDGEWQFQLNLRDAETEWDNLTDQDELRSLEDYEKRFADRFNERMAEEREAGTKPRVLQPWTGDPMTPLYLRPPFNE